MTPRALELSQKRQKKREIKGVRDQLNSIIYIDFIKILLCLKKIIHHWL